MACYTYKGVKYQNREELESFLVEEQIQFQKELGKNGISLETAGFVHKNQIYINSDIATEEVAVHEFGHLWNSWIKQNNPQLYETGIKLIKKEGKKYIDYVNKTQPNLVGERLYEEALAQAIGDNGKQLLDKNWINQVWDFIKDFFGLSQLTNEQIANLSLDEFARAASIDLLRGQDIRVQQAIQRNNGNPLNLTPNGKPSILYQSYKDLGYSEQEAERLTAQVYSDSFLDFFGDWINEPQNASKVVDENGQPLIMWHSSKDNFNKFDPIKIGENTSFENTKLGFFFAEREGIEILKAQNEDVFGNIEKPFFLNIKKPLDIRPSQWFTNETTAKALTDLIGEEFTPKEALEYVNDNIGLGEVGEIMEAFIEGKSNFIEQGFDGFFSDMGSEIREIIALNPNQIKSATENVGTFSTDSNDIRYQIIGEQGAQNIEQYKQLLEEAKELDKQGLDFSRTGWFKTLNNDWKYFSNEFLEQFKIKKGIVPNKSYNFEDVIEDNIYFEMYPESRNLQIIFYDNRFRNNKIEQRLQGANGAYSKDNNTIYVNIQNADGKGARHIIGHELNHFTQRMEGFPTGGSKVSIILYAIGSTNYDKNTDGNLKEYLQNYDRSLLSKNDVIIFDKAVKVYEAMENKDEQKLLQYYDSIEGEIDSRAVELAITLRDKYGLEKVTYENLRKQILKDSNISEEQVISLYFKDFNYDKQRGNDENRRSISRSNLQMSESDARDYDALVLRVGESDTNAETFVEGRGNMRGLQSKDTRDFSDEVDAVFRGQEDSDKGGSSDVRGENTNRISEVQGRSFGELRYSNLIDKNGEPSLSLVLNYALQNNAKLTREQKLDLQDFNQEVTKEQLKDIFFVDGVFTLNVKKMKTLYSPLEIEKILGSVEIQNNIKNSVQALQNSEDIEIEVFEQPVLKTNEINSFGKLRMLNPYKVKQETLNALVAQEELPYDVNINENLEDYKNAKLMAEDSNGNLINETDGVSAKIVKAVGRNSKVAQLIRTLAVLRQDVIFSGAKEVETLFEKATEELANIGIDVVDFTPQKIQELNAYFNSDQTLELTEPQETFQAVKGNIDAPYIKLKTTRTEEELFEQNNLVKVGTDLYIEINRQPVEQLREIVQSMFFLEDVSTLDELQLTKKALKLKEIPTVPNLSKFSGDYNYLTTEFLADFNIAAIKEKQKDSVLWKNFYSEFKITNNGIELKSNDPLTISRITEYADENLKQYSVISKSLPNLIEERNTEPRDVAVNFPQTIEKIKGNVFRTEQGNFIAKDNNNQFVNINGEVFEAVEQLGNLTLFAPLTINNSEYFILDNKQPRANESLENYEMLQSREDKFVSVKSFAEKNKIKNENFDCI